MIVLPWEGPYVHVKITSSKGSGTAFTEWPQGSSGRKPKGRSLPGEKAFLCNFRHNNRSGSARGQVRRNSKIMWSKETFQDKPKKIAPIKLLGLIATALRPIMLLGLLGLIIVIIINDECSREDRFAEVRRWTDRLERKPPLRSGMPRRPRAPRTKAFTTSLS